jgi:single-stranded-DNA-specific exonuclease
MESKKRWEVQPEPDESVFRSLPEFPKPIVRALFHRGIADAEGARVFFESESASPADPFRLTDMERAVDRIVRAVGAGEPIVVFGDYDTDGVTATAMLVDFLSAAGGRVDAYIPSRFEEGYGLNRPALEALSAQGARLVITVDCGARSVAEAHFARDLGLDLIITDHHPPGADEPPAFAFIDPKRKDDPYPDRNLSGVGVAHRLVEAVSRRIRRPDLRPEDYLDLVAVGTVADMVPLLGENRTLVQGGLKYLNDPARPLRPGMEQLLKVAGVVRGKLSAQGIGFILGPRLNASGRIDTADTALHLLRSKDGGIAREYAERLDAQNRARQSLTRTTVADARSLAAASGGWDPGTPPAFILIADAGFNPGVIGLAASKLMEEFHRPVAVVAIEGDRARGSVRSVPGFHITEALESCSPLLERFGGHAAAAGFTVARDRLPELQDRLVRLAGGALSGGAAQPVLQIDSEVRLADLTWELHRWIARLEPCGQGNPAPVFFARGLRIRNKRCVGKDGAHLKLSLTDGRLTFDAIAFGFGRAEPSLGETVDAAFALEENDYYGRQMQLRVIDLRG